MNEKEISEIRRRFRADKKQYHPCARVLRQRKSRKSSRNSTSCSPLLPQGMRKYASVLRRTLSGTLGKNLIEIPFTTAQVIDSDEHRLLMALRDSSLPMKKPYRCFFKKVIASYRPEGTYLILLANDTYDVPYRAKDGETLEDASENIYNYVLCTVCPVKQTKPVLGYDVPEKYVPQPRHRLALFPRRSWAFCSRRSPTAAPIFTAPCTTAAALPESYDEFIDAVFNREAPMPAEEQKTTFGTILGDALNDAVQFRRRTDCAQPPLRDD